MNYKKKIESIQVLRAFSIIIIFISHAGIGNYAILGAWGVSMFIILSGCLRGGVKINEYMNINIKDSLKFAVHKIKAYYPLHIVTMIAAIPLAIVKINNSDLDISTFVIQIVSSILMIRSWIPVHAIANSLNEVAWYLCLYFFFC